MVALLALPVADRPAGGRSEADGALILVQSLNPVHRAGPRVIDEDVDLVEAVPLLQVALAVGEAGAVVGVVAVAPALAGVGDARKRPGGAQIALIGMPGTRASLAVDEELAEVPRPLVHRRDLGPPEFSLALLPAADDPGAAEYRPLTRIGRVGDGGVRGPGVLRREDDRAAEPVHAAADEHGEGPGVGLPATRLTHSIPGAFQGREGPVLAGAIRLRQRARPRVLPIGPHVVVGLFRWPATALPRSQDGKRAYHHKAAGSQYHLHPPAPRRRFGSRPAAQDQELFRTPRERHRRAGSPRYRRL